MRREGWDGIRRVLAVRLDNVGDIIMLGPALRALGARFPDARITVLASASGAAAARLVPGIDGVMTARASWQDASAALPLDPRREVALIDSLRGGAFDAAFVFTSFSQSVWPPAYACYLAGIPVRVGQASDFGGSLLTDAVRPLPTSVHQVDRNLHLLEAVGIEAAGRTLEIRLDPGDIERADAVLRRAGIGSDDDFVLVAPGASCPARRYAPERFAQALSLLVRRTGLPAVVVGHPRETQLVRAVKAASRSRRVLTPCRDLTLGELAAAIARARLLVGNNSGPMHLADALRCPMVILYSGTDLEEQWRPRAAPARLLRRPTPCDPCYRFECPFQMECLDIPPREVVEACEELLDRTAHRAIRRVVPDRGRRPDRFPAPAALSSDGGATLGAERA